MKLTKNYFFCCSLLGILSLLGACALPCEEGETNFEIYQNESLLASGDELVIGDIVIGGGFQGGGAPAFGTWLNFRVSGTSRYQFEGINIAIYENDQQIGFGGISEELEFEEDRCQMEEAYWRMRPHISFPDAESIFDLDGLDVKMEVQLNTETQITKDYYLKLYVE